VTSGTSVYDWEVPPEWNIREAYIADSGGKRIVDFVDNNLHVVNYSVPINTKLPFNELRDHLHTLPGMADAIPYRTTYYERDWGFCLRHETLEAMDEDETYEVYIDSNLDSSGELTYADARIEGESNEEYIISTYCCHPSLANDNLSGLILATLLFERLRQHSTYHSYRLVIIPETIGAISYLHKHESEMKSINGGYVVTTVAGPGTFDYKASFEGNHPVDRAVQWALEGDEYDYHEFAPTGSDERQYSTPGFRIPTATIAKDKYYEYDFYHTSRDNLSFVSAEALLETLDRYLQAIHLLEKNRVYERVNPHCEFKLDRHDLHPTTGGQKKQPGHLEDENHGSFEYRVGDDTASGDVFDAINWLMFGCDGKTSLFQLAERSGMDPRTLHRAASELVNAGLLEDPV
jgi:aminopeptidase-like protein